jgi:hypothetical protein
MFTHNHTSSSVQSTLVLVVPRKSGMGGMLKRRMGGQRGDYPSSASCTQCVLLHWLLHSFLISQARLGELQKNALFFLQHHNQRPMPIRARPCSSPGGALNGTLAPVLKAFPFSHKPNTPLDCSRIYVPWGWESKYCGTALMRKGRKRHWACRWNLRGRRGRSAKAVHPCAG